MNATINLLRSFGISFALLIIAMSIHEFSHGWVAYKLGDPTAKYSGRLTLNPLAHIDPLWTFILPLLLYISSNGSFVFGAAKPVPINYLALKNPKRDIVWIGLSGPAANFILAAVLALAIKLIPLSVYLNFILVNLIAINVVLGVFNLIPIPPLDGSRILIGVLPDNIASLYARIEPFTFIILILLIGAGFFGSIIWPIAVFILRLLGINY